MHMDVQTPAEAPSSTVRPTKSSRAPLSDSNSETESREDISLAAQASLKASFDAEHQKLLQRPAAAAQSPRSGQKQELERQKEAEV